MLKLKLYLLRICLLKILIKGLIKMTTNLADYHIHTFFSGDSNASPDTIVQTAIEKGLCSICITDHLDFDYIEDGIRFELDNDKYFNYLLELKNKYIDKLDIRIGIETGLEPGKAKRLYDFINRHDYDFVIGSSHLINGIDPYYPEYFYNKTDYQAFMEYFESILTNLKSCRNFDVYGHLDYVVRYSPNKDKNYILSDYSSVIDEILINLITNGKGIEINTSGFRSGLSNPNPRLEIIKRYHKLGGEIITLGSDAHYPKHIAYNFDKALEILKVCGFKYYTQFKNRKPEFIKLF